MMLRCALSLLLPSRAFQANIVSVGGRTVPFFEVSRAFVEGECTHGSARIHRRYRRKTR